MTPKEEKKLKEKHFGASSKRTGIPLQFYELPQEVIDAYEREKTAAREEKLRKEKEAREAKKKLNPTRGEVDFHRKVRREVGM